MPEVENRDDFEDVEEVWVGGSLSLDGEEFTESLRAVERLIEAMQEVQDELADINVGLEEEDAIRLVYAKNHNLTLQEVRDVFVAIDSLAEGDPRTAGKRLLALNTDLTIEKTGEVLDEIGKLAEKYAEPEDDN